MRPPVELDQLAQVAWELDDEASSPPCSQAEVVRDAHDEIERLREEVARLRAEKERLITCLEPTKTSGRMLRLTVDAT